MALFSPTSLVAGGFLLNDKLLLSQQLHFLDKHIAHKNSIQDSVQQTALCSSTFFIPAAEMPSSRARHGYCGRFVEAERQLAEQSPRVPAAPPACSAMGGLRAGGRSAERGPGLRCNWSTVFELLLAWIQLVQQSRKGDFLIRNRLANCSDTPMLMKTAHLLS